MSLQNKSLYQVNEVCILHEMWSVFLLKALRLKRVKLWLTVLLSYADLYVLHDFTRHRDSFAVVL